MAVEISAVACRMDLYPRVLSRKPKLATRHLIMMKSSLDHMPLEKHLDRLGQDAAQVPALTSASLRALAASFTHTKHFDCEVLEKHRCRLQRQFMSKLFKTFHCDGALADRRG
jgi:hypothetical protein